nr:GNAT family N-acetyltransferase [Virgibacillus sp. Bac330]
MFDTKRGYPVLHKIDKLDAVYGELYQVDKAGLHLLDELEGYTICEANDNLYERMIQTVFTKQGELDAFDIPMLYANLWDHEGRRFTGTQAKFSLKGVEQFITSAANDQTRMDLLICLQENDLCIGDIAMSDIDWQNRNASVRIAIFNKAYWGNGYGTEAMEQ